MKKQLQLLSLVVATLVSGPTFASNPDGIIISLVFIPASVIIGSAALAFLLSSLKPQSGFRAGAILTVLSLVNLGASWSMWSRERLFEELGAGVFDNIAITAGAFIVPVILSVALMLRHWSGRAA